MRSIRSASCSGSGADCGAGADATTGGAGSAASGAKAMARLRPVLPRSRRTAASSEPSAAPKARGRVPSQFNGRWSRSHPPSPSSWTNARPTLRLLTSPSSLSLSLLFPVSVNPKRVSRSLLEISRASANSPTRIALSVGVRSSLPGIMTSFRDRAPSRGDEFLDLPDHGRHVPGDLVVGEADDREAVLWQQPVSAPVRLVAQRLQVLRPVDLDHAPLRLPQQVKTDRGLQRA